LLVKGLLLFFIATSCAADNLIANSLETNSLAIFDCKPKPPKLGIILKTSQQQANKALGCQVKQIIPLSIAWASKLRANDWIFSVNHNSLKRKDDPCQLFKETLLKSKTDLVELTIYSTVDKVPQKITLDRATPSKFKLASSNNQQNKNCLSSTSAIEILPQIQKIQAKPAILKSEMNNLQIKIEQSKNTLSSIRSIIQPENDVNDKKIKQSNRDQLVNLRLFLSKSKQLSKDAFSNLSIEDKQFFKQNYMQLSNTIEQSHQLINVSNREKIEVIVRLFEIASKVDYSKLELAAKYWFQLEDYDWSNIKFSKQKQVYPTQFGTLIIGTYADDMYNLDEGNVTIIIDPGGNDQYLKKKDSHNNRHYNMAIIDLSGNDQYLSTAERGISSAILGISLLLD
jgi:hypothetical protein